MATQRANHLLNQLNNRIDAKDTEKTKRLAEKERKHQQRTQEEHMKTRFERDEQLLLRMADKNKTREERQDSKKPSQTESDLTKKQQNRITAKLKHNKNQRQRVNYDEERTRAAEHQLGRCIALARQRRHHVYE